jgi:hypothetical protein
MVGSGYSNRFANTGGCHRAIILVFKVNDFAGHWCQGDTTILDSDLRQLLNASLPPAGLFPHLSMFFPLFRYPEQYCDESGELGGDGQLALPDELGSVAPAAA